MAGKVNSLAITPKFVELGSFTHESLISQQQVEGKYWSAVADFHHPRNQDLESGHLGYT